MDRPVLFRVDGNAPIGMGHVTRCAALAAELERLGFGPFLFLIRDYQPAVEFFTSRSLPFRKLPAIEEGASSSIDEALMVHSVAEEINPVVVIFDLLEIDDRYIMAAVSKDSKAVALFDKVAPPQILSACVFNHNVVWWTGLIDHPGGAQFGGPDYVILDPIYAKVRNDYRFSSKVERIFLNQGGGDPFNLTTKIVRSLSPLIGSLFLDVVLGGAFAFDEDLSEALRSWGDRVAVHRSVPPSSLVQLMANAQLAHTAGGNMLYELLTLGVPSLVVSHHESHAKVAEWFSHRGAAVHLGIGTEIGDEIILDQTRTLIENEHGRRQLHVRGRELVDGLGARRTAEKIADRVST